MKATVTLTPLFLVLVASARPSWSCDFSRSNLEVSARSAAQFFSLPVGAIAIGENCNSANNICQKHFVITQCLDVNYPVFVFNDPSISIVINTSKGCSGDGENCPIENSYLAATAVYINNQISRENLSTVELVRNAGWFKPYSFDRKYKLFFRKIVPESRVSKFFELQTAADSELDSFESQVIKYFHATPELGEDSSWAHKEIFATAFSRLADCRPQENLCTLKSYLVKFSETPSGIPSIALRINSTLSNADGVRLRTFSPISIYNKEITIHFNWPTPLPQPKPAGIASRW